MTSTISYDHRALEKRAENQWRRVVADVQPKPESRLKAIFAYGVVAAGVAVAAFYVTPSHAASNTSSIVYMGTQAKINVRRDDNKAINQMEIDRRKFVNQMKLEEAKSLYARQLEEDKAYHKKLEWQRKNGK
jgi:hypothetical protein